MRLVDMSRNGFVSMLKFFAYWIGQFLLLLGKCLIWLVCLFVDFVKWGFNQAPLLLPSIALAGIGAIWLFTLMLMFSVKNKKRRAAYYNKGLTITILWIVAWVSVFMWVVFT